MTCFNVRDNPFPEHDFIPTQFPWKKLRVDIGMQEKNCYAGRIRLGWLKGMAAMSVVNWIFGWLDPIVEDADTITLTEVGVIGTEGGRKQPVWIGKDGAGLTYQVPVGKRSNVEDLTFKDVFNVGYGFAFNPNQFSWYR